MARNPPVVRSLAPIVSEMKNPSKEVQRALVTPKGGELWGLQNAATNISTFFTEPGEAHRLYTAENWVRIQLTLETAGPVAIGTSQNLSPITSGKGILLGTNEPRIIVLPRATTIYIIAGSVNRVTVVIEPIPMLEQLSMQLGAIHGGIQQLVAAVSSSLNALFQRIR